MPTHFDDNPLAAYFKNADGSYTPLGGFESVTMCVDSDSPNVSGVDLSAGMTELSGSFRWKMPHISRKRFIRGLERLGVESKAAKQIARHTRGHYAEEFLVWHRLLIR